MLGNNVVGILSESGNKWERRAPLAPSHCAKLLKEGRDKTGVAKIVVQPSTKRIYHDEMYEDVGCEISTDVSQCGLIVGVKQPKEILSDRAYAFFSHTHKAQKENMPLLNKILKERVSLYDYELIVGDDSKRLLAFGKFAGRAGLVDILHGLGRRYLSLGYSTPFLSLAMSYMYPSLAAAKAAVISVGEEIATSGLPAGICPLVFIFTGTGNVSQGAQEIFKLLPHSYVDPSKLPDLFPKDGGLRASKRVRHVYGCVVTCQDMVKHSDSSGPFDKTDYYTHPEQYQSVFHEKIAPYASVVVNCMYWEKRFPRLLNMKQAQDLQRNECPLVGVADITCDIGGSIEFINQGTTIDSPFIRYDPLKHSYHSDMEGDGLIFSSVDILPTEFAKEASQHFGDTLYKFVRSLASTTDISNLPAHLRRSCIAHRGTLTPCFQYIPRIQNSETEFTYGDVAETFPNSYLGNQKFSILVSIRGHLFDQFLINEALDIIETAGGSFHLLKCQVGQNADSLSYSELRVGAEDRAVLDQIIDSLTFLANPNGDYDCGAVGASRISLKVRRVQDGNTQENGFSKNTQILILGSGRVCLPAVRFLASVGNNIDELYEVSSDRKFDMLPDIVVASINLREAEEITRGISNATAIQLDVSDTEILVKYVSQADVVISLLPASCHTSVANACIECKKHLVTSSYVDSSMLMIGEKAKAADITILCEMGLDPGIDHMIAMKMIDKAHTQNGKIISFKSYCGGLPSPAAANNPLAYKFSWSPAGTLRAGMNHAAYKSEGKIVHVDGDRLYDSAEKFRLHDFPAFALECLPNRNSLTYGDLYSIENEAQTIFRGTLRYEGYSNIMRTLKELGLFSDEPHPLLNEEKKCTYYSFLCEILGHESKESTERTFGEEDIIESIFSRVNCNDRSKAVNAAKTIRFIGMDELVEIPSHCKTPFEVTCSRMVERMSYSLSEQDIVLLHVEAQIEYPDRNTTETCITSLLEFGKTNDGKQVTAMALTVGTTAAVGALLLAQNKITRRGVIRPLEPEVYIPALDILQAEGIKLMEKVV